MDKAGRGFGSFASIRLLTSAAAFALAVAVLLVGSAGAVAPSYTIIDLGALAGNTSRAEDINERGQVVGSSTTASGETHAFLWQDGVMHDLGTPEGINTADARAVNDRGQIVGSGRCVCPPEPGPFSALLWRDGEITNLGTLGRLFDSSAANGINNRGQIVGSSWTLMVHPEAPENERAVLWQDGEITDLGTLGGGVSLARALNERGQIVGSSRTVSGDQHAFLWQDGVMSDLGTLGGSFSFATGINERGQVVGFSTTASGAEDVFLWRGRGISD